MDQSAKDQWDMNALQSAIVNGIVLISCLVVLIWPNHVGARRCMFITNLILYILIVCYFTGSIFLLSVWGMNYEEWKNDETIIEKDVIFSMAKGLLVMLVAFMII